MDVVVVFDPAELYFFVWYGGYFNQASLPFSQMVLTTGKRSE